jgi:hypothetical protein
MWELSHRKNRRRLLLDCFRPLIFCILNSRTDLRSPLSGVLAQNLIVA